jgi:glycerol-3-phosphate dehydrogenase (NAD(P)+)
VSIAVVGAGAFGQGLAHAVARAAQRRGGAPVTLWSREARSLGVDGIHSTGDLDEVVACELIILAVPAQHAAEVLDRMAPSLHGGHLMVHVTRGLVDESLKPMSHVIRTTTSVRRVGALAGPLTAVALRDGDPGGGVIGSDFPEVIAATKRAIASPSLRLYGTSDMLGVEYGSALTGMLLFALGTAKGMGLDAATLGVLGARGLAEATRVGVAMGARAETFSGLACVGDLLAAVAGEARPEMEAGRRLAEGDSTADAVGGSPVRIEGHTVALRVAELADRMRIDTPIASVMAALLSGKLQPAEAVRQLMERRAGSE